MTNTKEVYSTPAVEVIGMKPDNVIMAVSPEGTPGSDVGYNQYIG